MGRRIVVLHTGDTQPDTNFREIQRQFVEMPDLAFAKGPQTVTLAVGDNKIKPGIAKPRGRIVVYQDAAATLYDKGSNADGDWVLNASAACTIRIFFF